MPMSKSDIVRALNAQGCQLYEQFVLAAKADPSLPPPAALLYDERCSVPLAVEIPVSRRKFVTRYDLGAHLEKILVPLDARRISRDQGLWNWLSLYYFDQLWTPKRDGSRSLGEV